VKRNFSDDQKRNQLVKIVAPITAEGVTDKREDNGPAPVHSDLTLYATIISPSKSVTYNVPAPATGGKRKSYIHVVQTSGYNTKKSTGATVSVDGGETKLSEGDGTFAYSEGEGGKIEITNVGDKDAEVLVFDLE
jgi:redox-sensitive bicupin YhaK (pirin superfamily)